MTNLPPLSAGTKSRLGCGESVLLMSSEDTQDSTARCGQTGIAGSSTSKNARKRFESRFLRQYVEALLIAILPSIAPYLQITSRPLVQISSKETGEKE
jgi:hypothetical protein